MLQEPRYVGFWLKEGNVTVGGKVPRTRTYHKDRKSDASILRDHVELDIYLGEDDVSRWVCIFLS